MKITSFTVLSNDVSLRVKIFPIFSTFFHCIFQDIFTFPLSFQRRLGEGTQSIYTSTRLYPGYVQLNRSNQGTGHCARVQAGTGEKRTSAVRQYRGQYGNDPQFHD
jgi:hypothetical protein